jgi:hypothetical protein
LCLPHICRAQGLFCNRPGTYGDPNTHTHTQPHPWVPCPRLLSFPSPGLPSVTPQDSGQHHWLSPLSRRHVLVLEVGTPLGGCTWLPAVLCPNRDWSMNPYFSVTDSQMQEVLVTWGQDLDPNEEEPERDMESPLWRHAESPLPGLRTC